MKAIKRRGGPSRLWHRLLNLVVAVLMLTQPAPGGFLWQLDLVAWAAVPWMINYQGRLTDAGNEAVTGTFTMTFRLYDDPNSGAEQWEEEQTVTLTQGDNGIFSVVLGAVTGLWGVSFNSPLWLSVQVNDDPEMTPRQRLTATGYAMNADQIDSLNSTSFMRTDVDTSTSGKLTITRSGVALVIQPATDPAANTQLIEVKNAAGTNRFTVDLEGDVTVAGDLTVSGTIGGSTSTTGTTNPSWNVGSTTDATAVDTSVLFGQTGQESLVFDGNGVDDFALSDDLRLSAQSALRLEDDAGGDAVSLVAPTGVTSYALTLPAAVGGNGQVLKTDASGVLSWADDDNAGGTVTSVGLIMPAEFSVANSPVTTAGALTVTKAAQAANALYAGPASGAAAVPGFRTLVDDDVPDTVSLDWAGLQAYPSGCGAGQVVQAVGDTLTCVAVNTDTSITLQDAYDLGNAITTTDNRNIAILLDDTATDSDFLINMAGTGNVVEVQDGGTMVARISDGGAATFQTSADSATGFQILDANGGNPVLNVDTANERVGIGVAAPLQDLHIQGANTGGIRIETPVGGSQGRIDFFNGGSRHGVISSENSSGGMNFDQYAGPIRFMIDNDTKMTVSTTGAVGINNFTPTEGLHLVGGLRVGEAPTAPSLLDGGINAVDTVITVDDTTGYPVAGGTLLIDGEAMTYTGTTATTFTGVTRGALGTVAAVHADNAPVANYLVTAVASAADPKMVLTGAGNLGLGVLDPDEQLELAGRLHLNPVTAPADTTGKLYNIGGALYWDGIDLTGFSTNPSFASISSGVNTGAGMEVGNGASLYASGTGIVRATDLQAGSSVVADAEVDDNITLTNLTQISTRSFADLQATCADGQVVGGNAAGTGLECQADQNSGGTVTSVTGTAPIASSGGNTPAISLNADGVTAAHLADNLDLAAAGETTLTITGNAVVQSSTDSLTGVQVLDADGGNPVLNVDTLNERIGIGTATPSEKLYLAGGSMFIENQQMVKFGQGNNTLGASLYVDNGNGLNVQVDRASESIAFRLHDGASVKRMMYVDADYGGMVGIGLGNNSAVTRLDVDGSTRLEASAASVLTGSIDPDGDTSVTGVGTFFTRELVTGDRITVSGETRTVTAITDDTNLTVATAFTDTANDTSPDKLPAALTVRDAAGGIDMLVQDNGNVGIGVAAPTNRLQVAGDSALFESAGDMRLYVSKNAPANTGSVIFQDNYSARAEIGLAGDDKFQINVTPDNAVWYDALTIDQTNGNVGLGVTDPDEQLELTGRMHLAPVAAPADTTDKLYNVGGALYWDGIDLTGFSTNPSFASISSGVNNSAGMEVGNGASLYPSGTGIVRANDLVAASSVVADAEVDDNITLGATASVDAAAINSGTVDNARLDAAVSLLGQTIADAEVDDNISISNTGSVHWTALNNYPAACGAGQVIQAVGDALTCVAVNTDTSITLQDAYDLGNAITTTDNRNIAVLLDDTATDSDFLINMAGTGNVFQVQDGGSAMFTVQDAPPLNSSGEAVVVSPTLNDMDGAADLAKAMTIRPDHSGVVTNGRLYGLSVEGGSPNATLNSTGISVSGSWDTMASFGGNVSINGNGSLGIEVPSPGAKIDVDAVDVGNGGGAESIMIRSNAQSITLTDGTTRATHRQNQFLAPAFLGVAGGGSEAVTNAATVYIDGAPSAGTDMTITNPYALWLDAGNARMDGNLALGGIVTPDESVHTAGRMHLEQTSAPGDTTDKLYNVGGALYWDGIDLTGFSTNPSFASISSGVNNSAGMEVGNGASLYPSGTGIVRANDVVSATSIVSDAEVDNNITIASTAGGSFAPTADVSPLVLRRGTDTTPAADLVSIRNAANDTDLFTVSANGTLTAGAVPFARITGFGGDTTPDTIADDGTITLGVETTGTYDATGDTIADDGVISNAEVDDDLTISGGTVNNSVIGGVTPAAATVTALTAIGNTVLGDHSTDTVVLDSEAAGNNAVADAPQLLLRGSYDSDVTGALSLADYDLALTHNLGSAGPSPISQFEVNFGGGAAELVLGNTGSLTLGDAASDLLTLDTAAVTDNVLNDSSALRLQGRYDSDPGAGVTGVSTVVDLQHNVTSQAGASQFEVNFGGGGAEFAISSSGQVTTGGWQGSTIGVGYGGTGLTSALDDRLMIGDGAAWVSSPMPTGGTLGCSGANDKLLYNTATNTFTCGADAGAAGLGDNVQVGGADVSDVNILDTAVSGSVAGVDFSLNTGTNPDALTATVSVASATEAGVVTTGTQTLAGSKTFTGNATTFQNVTDGASSLQVLDADGGNPVLNIDTVNERVGIGTTNPGVTLGVIGTISAAGSAGTEALSTFNSSTGTTTFMATTQGTVGIYGVGGYPNSAALMISGNNQKTGGNYLQIEDGTNPAMLSVDVAGRLGIGTTSPSAKVHAQAMAAASGTGTLSGGLAVNGSSTAFNSQLRPGDVITAAGQTRTIATVDSDTLLTVTAAFSPVLSGDAFTYQQPAVRFANSSGATQALVTANGNMGIGTAAPNEKLTIEGPFSFREQASAPALTTNYGKLYAKNDSKLYFLNDNGVEYDLTVGSTGIAWSTLTNPVGSLNLSMGDNSTTFTYNNATSTANLFNLTDSASNSGTGYMLNVTTATGSNVKPLHVSASGNEALTVLANGFVGMGVVDPDEQLEIAGRLHLGATTAPGTTTEKLYNVGGTLFWNGVDISTPPAADTLQTAYAAGNTITTTDGRNVAMTLADTATDADFLVNMQGTGNVVEVQDAGTPVFRIADEGALLVQTKTDSTTGVQVLDANGGVPILNIDTVNERLGIGTSSPNSALHVLTPSGGYALEIEETSGSEMWRLQTNSTGDLVFDNLQTHVVFQDSGNVAIGTSTNTGILTVNTNTTTGNSSSETLRLISNDSNSQATNGIGAYLNYSLETDNNTTMADAARIEAVLDDAANASRDASLRWYTLGPDAGSAATPTEKMRLSSAGNFGLGTIAPTAQYHQRGSLTSQLTGTVTVGAGTPDVTGSGTAFLAELNLGDAIKIGTEVFTVSAIGGNTSLTLDSNHIAGAAGAAAYRDPVLMQVETGDAVSKLSLTRSGNLSLGTTAQPAKLALASNGTIDAVRIEVASESAAMLSMANGAAGTGSAMYLSNGGALKFNVGGATDVLAMTTAGNVGLGMLDPDEQLEMTGRLHLGQTTAPATTTDKLYNVGGGLFWNGAQVVTGTTANDSLQTAYATGNTVTTTDNRNLAISLADTATDSDFLVNMLGTGNVVEVQDAGTPVFRVADEGAALFQTKTDSATGLQVLDADGGDPVLNVDTANERVGIGLADPASALDVNGDIRLDSNLVNTYDWGNITWNTNWNVDSFKYLANGYANRIEAQGDIGGLTFYTAPSGTAGTAVSNVLTMHLGPTGNVGIGNDAPRTRLDVSGSAHVKAAASSTLTGAIDPDGDTSVTGVGTLFTRELVVGDRITVSGETRTVVGITDDLNLTVDSAFADNANDASPDRLPAAFAVKDASDTTRLLVSDTGNVGISTTVMNQSRLRVEGNTTGQAVGQFLNFADPYNDTGVVSAQQEAVASNTSMAFHARNRSTDTENSHLFLGEDGSTTRFAVSTGGHVKMAQTSAPSTTTDKLYNVGGTLYWAGNALTTSAGSTLQAAYGAGNTISTTDNRNVAISLADTATDSDFLVNMLGTGNVVEVQDAGTPVFRVADEGAALFQTKTDSATGLQVLDADGGNPVLNIDTLNERVGIGTSSPAGLLDISGANFKIGPVSMAAPVSAGNRLDFGELTMYTDWPSLAMNSYWDGTNDRYISNDSAFTVTQDQNNDVLMFEYAPVGTAGNAFTYNTAMAVDTTGKIGMGTITPRVKLDVDGTARIKGAAASVLTGSIDPDGDTSVTGVGTAFTSQLVVGDRITVSGETRTVTAITDNTNLTVDPAFSNNANDLSVDRLPAVLIAHDAADNLKLVVNDQGHVGIGTANPDQPVTIFGSAAAEGIHILSPDTQGLYVLSDVTPGYLNPMSQAGDALIALQGTALDNADSGGLVIGPWSASAKGIRMDASGNVGLGVADPDEQLEMTGRLHLGQTTAPGAVTDKLYNVGGGLFWNGAQVVTGTTANDSLQTAYATGNSITTTDNRNIAISLADTATDSDFLVNLLGTGNVFEIQDAGTPVFTIGDNGAASFSSTATAASGAAQGAGFTSTLTASANNDILSAVKLTPTFNNGAHTGVRDFGLEIAPTANSWSRIGLLTTGGGSSQVDFGSNGSYAGGATVRYNGNVTGALEFGTGGSFSRMLISSTGDVGIGTTVPLTKLDVVGSARVKGSATSVLTGSIDPDGDTTVTGVGTLFTTQLVPGDRITVSGETRTVVTIADNLNLTVDTAFANNANDTTPDRLPAEWIVKDAADGVDLAVLENGYVGMGTMAPQHPLHVVQALNGGARGDIINVTDDTLASAIWSVSSATATGAFSVQPANYTAAGGTGTHFADRVALQAATDASGLDLLSAGATGDLRVYTGGVATTNERMRIDSTGNLNILAQGDLRLQDDTGGQYVALQAAAGTTSHTMTMPVNNGTGVLTNDGSGNLSWGAGASSTTLQQAYGNDVDGGDSIVALTNNDDSVIFRNPAASGTDSTAAVIVDQLATGAVDGLFINQAGSTSGLEVYSNVGAPATDNLVSIRVDDPAFDQNAVYIRNDGNGTGLKIDQSTTGLSEGLVVYSNTNGAVQWPLVSLHADDPAFDVAALRVQQDGTGDLLNLYDDANLVARIADNGLATFQTKTDSATGFQVLDADGGNPVLNVDTLNEYVGIGRSDPFASLTVRGATSGSALNGIVYEDADGAGAVMLGDAGSIGVGLFSSSSWGTSSVLVSAANGGVSNGGLLKVNNSAPVTGKGDIELWGGYWAPAAMYGDINFRTGSSSAVNMTVQDTGLVGIGTSSPVTKLDVAGSVRVQATAASVLTGSIDPTASTSVTGVGTAFLTELVPGDRITVSGETRTVSAIASNTSLTVSSAFTDVANDTSVDRLPSPFTILDSGNSLVTAVQSNGAFGNFATMTLDNATEYGLLSTAFASTATPAPYSKIANGSLVFSTHSSGTMGALIGVSGIANKAGTGAVTSAVGVHAQVTNLNATGTITDGYGVYISDSTETGTITNDWGLYQVDTGALNFFGGNLGIGATPTNNKLQVAGTTALFESAGDFRLNVSKNAAGNTGSIVFQDNYSGRAEIGLTGDDKLHMKVSSNGSSWVEGITIDQTNGQVGFTGITSPDESIHTGGRIHLGQTTAPSTTTDKLYNVAGNLFWNGAQVATGGSIGDSLQVNGSAVSSTGNIVNTAATGTVPSITWNLTGGSPDTISISGIGAASATTAGVVTTGTQTIVGAKTLDGVLAIDTDTGNQRTNITRLGATDETLQMWTDDTDANLLSDQDENSGSTGNMRFMIDDDGSATSYFHFETKSGTDLLRMNRNGTIGIGTAGPTATLDVNSGIALAPAAGASSRVLNLGGTITEAGSGNHVLLAGLEIAPPTITGAAATVSDTASLYVANAPTATVSGANHALWVDAGKTRLDGDLDVAGVVTYTGTKPKRTIILTAGGALAGPSSTFADQQRTDGTNLSYFTLNYDATSDEKAFWEFVVPDSYTGTTAQVTLYWLYTGGNCSAGSCEVQWNVEMDGKAAGATLDSALQTAAVDTASGGNAGVLNASAAMNVTTGWAPGEMAVVKVSRDADHASDDLGADAKLVHVKIEWDAASESD